MLRRSKQVSEIGLCDRSETGVNPRRDVIKKVLYCIRILSRKLLALRAGCNSVSRSFDHDEVLIGAGGNFVVELIIAEISYSTIADSAHCCIELSNTFFECQPLTFLMATRNKQLDCSC